jgi:protein-S-isoprenylcysteine O-methyltransferase Ste14
MPNTIKSYLLVFFQFSLIGILFFTSIDFNFNPLAIALITTSILLLLGAILAMQSSKLRIRPEPMAAATLITKGPYKLIRHPMYTAVLIGCTALIIHDYNLIRLVMFVSLTLVLLIKLTWEEKMLSEKFHDYNNYMKTSYRLIPFLF